MIVSDASQGRVLFNGENIEYIGLVVAVYMPLRYV